MFEKKTQVSQTTLLPNIMKFKIPKRRSSRIQAIKTQNTKNVERLNEKNLSHSSSCSDSSSGEEYNPIKTPKRKS
ncbi:hypothetical protein BpHYR1_006072 [Brachionus plicatilis]|uniref:Uncharacterized protein n=1 Tax=Brachionus plicatilis TaxID=10195 RepID=A0A3M7RDB7_BRAPC|nr:hypothetical protein BpHYR1_006072 [Brachionus plicatilis]